MSEAVYTDCWVFDEIRERVLDRGAGNGHQYCAKSAILQAADSWKNAEFQHRQPGCSSLTVTEVRRHR